MKKWIIALLVVCLVVAGAIGYLSYRGSAKLPEPSAATETESGEAAETAAPGRLDFEALYASHEPDEVVAYIGDYPVTWSEYFYMLHSEGVSLENYFDTLAMYYGMEKNWSDSQEEDGETYAALVIEDTESALKQFSAIEQFAADNNVTLTEEDLADMQAQLEADIAYYCGEDATEEDFEAYLAQIYVTRAEYDRIARINMLYNEGFIQVYGESGENISEEDALRYLEENGYLACSHILLMTIDPSTGESLDEETVAAKKTQAEEFAAELQAIEDPEERYARFRELKDEFCEDTGKVRMPDGYLFTPGTMVAVFEETAKALSPFEVSDPVESSYGWHVIIGQALDADKVIQYSDSGTPLTARSLLANEEYGRRLQETINGLEIRYVDGFEKPNLLAWVA